MSKSNKEKRKAIFKLFSQNLEWVKEHPDISFNPDFQNGYICPLCFDVFYENDLDNSVPNPLTLEDIPPASLGGKPQTLTCKNCNSKSGHDLDVHLLNSLLEQDSHSFLPNSKTNATFELNGNKINGIVEVNEKGIVKLDLQSNRSNPGQSNQFLKDLIPPKILPEQKFQTPNFQIKLNDRSNERRAEVALLRIAYLIAYSTLGNGFYVNGELSKVREQILNPDKNILPKVFWIKYDFPKEIEGVNIISLPKDLRSFLIVFSLHTKSKSRQFAIVLPGATSPGLGVYDFIENNLCVGRNGFLNGMIEHIPSRDYLRNKDYVFAGQQYWQEYTKEDYKPRLKPYTDIQAC